MGELEADLAPAKVTAPERVLLGIAVLGLFAMAVLVTTNVTSRWIGRALIPDDILLVQELMVLVILLPIGAVTALRQHISVDLFTEKVGSFGQRLLALLGHFVGLGFAGFLLSAAWQGFKQAWATQDYYSGFFDIPMWFGHGAFVFGIALFLLRLVIMIGIDLRALSSRVN